MESAKKIPEPDPARGIPLFYSIQEDDWVYLTQPRTSMQIENEEPDMDEEFEKYLRENIPWYEEETYWGEEWEMPEEFSKKEMNWEDGW